MGGALDQRSRRALRKYMYMYPVASILTLSETNDLHIAVPNPKLQKLIYYDDERQVLFMTPATFVDHKWIRNLDINWTYSTVFPLVRVKDERVG